MLIECFFLHFQLNNFYFFLSLSLTLSENSNESVHCFPKCISKFFMMLINSIGHLELHFIFINNFFEDKNEKFRTKNVHSFKIPNSLKELNCCCWCALTVWFTIMFYLKQNKKNCYLCHDLHSLFKINEYWNSHFIKK